MVDYQIFQGAAMSLYSESLSWQLESNIPYLPIYHQGEIVGFLKKQYAEDIIQFLNEDEVLKKALKMACIELTKQSGGELKQVKDLMTKYIKMCERPKYGMRAIASLLRDRQQELDLNNQEFTKFCDTFKLSPVELNSIYIGESVDDSLLSPLSRILGISKTELCQIRDGHETEVVNG